MVRKAGIEIRNRRVQTLATSEAHFGRQFEVSDAENIQKINKIAVEVNRKQLKQLPCAKINYKTNISNLLPTKL